MTDGLISEESMASVMCGERNLHQEWVIAYFRMEDAEQGLRSISHAGGSRFDTSQIGNPSPRRSGITIWFSCEHCTGLTTKLHIYQHKGSTIIESVEAGDDDEDLSVH